MARHKVGLVGASGETGSSIVEAMLEDGNFEIVALTRPASISKPANQELKKRGIELRELDLKGSQDSMVSALKDIEVLLSAIGPNDQLEQLPLATAAKAAGVKRFLPCGYQSVIPVGIHVLRDQKELVYNHVKRLKLPYTMIDVGWWYQISFPGLPSGKIDYAIGIPGASIAGDGNQPSALTDLRDIGRYMVKVALDDRTLNQYVMVYNEMWSQNQIYDVLEKLSGEKLARKYDSLEILQNRIKDAEGKFKDNPDDFTTMLQLLGSQYLVSWGVRGDNTPEYAKYLGYLTSKELYPDMEFTKFEDYLREVLGGNAKPVYPELKKNFADSFKKIND